MYQETLDHFAQLARKKTDLLNRSPGAFIVGSMMAGAYVGIGIILIFSVGSAIDPAWQRLVMGASFGVALTLVVFAGSKLFTGHTMYMVPSWLKRKTDGADLARVWVVSWIINLAGSAVLALLFVVGGGGAELADGTTLLFDIAA